MCFGEQVLPFYFHRNVQTRIFVAHMPPVETELKAQKPKNLTFFKAKHVGFAAIFKHCNTSFRVKCSKNQICIIMKFIILRYNHSNVQANNQRETSFFCIILGFVVVF